MSFLDQFANNRWRPEKPARSFTVVKANSWDEATYTGGARSIPALDAMVEELMVLDGLDRSPELVQDLFMLAYKGFPQLRTKRELDTSVKVNKQIVDILADLPDLSVLQQFSGGDVALSLVALEKLIPAVKELLKNAAPPPPPEPDKDQPEQPEPSDGDKGEPGSSEGESGEPGRPEGEPGEPGEGQEADEGEPNGDDDDSWDDEPASIDPAQAEAILAKGMEDAKEAAEQIRTQELSFGSEAGEWAADADPATRLATLDRMKHMKRLLDLVGRMTRFAMGEYANRITPSEHEMYGVRMGNQMQRILPSSSSAGTPGANFWNGRCAANNGRVKARS